MRGGAEIRSIIIGDSGDVGPKADIGSAGKKVSDVCRVIISAYTPTSAISILSLEARAYSRPAALMGAESATAIRFLSTRA